MKFISLATRFSVKLRMMLALPVLAIMPLGAQQFEGAIDVRMSMSKSEQLTSVMLVKGDRVAMTMTLPASAGPMAGQEARIIPSPDGASMTMLMPLPAGMPAMGGAKGMKMVMKLGDVSKSDTDRIAKSELTKLGTSQTVAEMKCDDYELAVEGEKPTRMCLTGGMGRFVYPSMGGRGSSEPDWTRKVREKGLFPLKVWTTDGNVGLEVTAVTRKKVPASAFEIPDGYMDASAMMGGMGRRP